VPLQHPAELRPVCPCRGSAPERAAAICDGLLGQTAITWLQSAAARERACVAATQARWLHSLQPRACAAQRPRSDGWAYVQLPSKGLAAGRRHLSGRAICCSNDPELPPCPADASRTQLLNGSPQPPCLVEGRLLAPDEHQALLPPRSSREQLGLVRTAESGARKGAGRPWTAARYQATRKLARYHLCAGAAGLQRKCPHKSGCAQSGPSLPQAVSKR